MKDGVKERNVDTNLEWATSKENKEHMYTALGHSPARNKVECFLQHPNGDLIPFISESEACRFASDNYGVSKTSLRRYKKSRGFELVWEGAETNSRVEDKLPLEAQRA